MPTVLPSGDAIWRWIEGLQHNEESNRAREREASAGCVATPAVVAQVMARRLWQGWSGPAPVRVLDAGCGNATLLAAVVREGARRRFVIDATGVDSDVEAVAWSAGLSHLMQRAAGARLHSWTILHRDYLLQPPPGPFDLIIANPPYVSLRSLAASQRQRLRRVSPAGRGDLSLLFLQTMLQQLAPGGRLCAIVPNKILASHYAADLRRCMLTRYRLREVHDLSEGQTFPGVGAYPVILVVEHAAARGSIQLFGAAGKRRGALRARDVLDLPDSLLPLRLPAELLSLVLRLRQQGTFESHNRLACGLASSGFGRGVGRGPERILLSGDVLPFRLRQRRAFDPKRAGVVPQRLQRQRVEKIVVPGMFRDLCAARAQATDLLGRVYWIPVQSTENGRRQAALLLALLNSRLFRVLYRGLFHGVAQAGGWLRCNGPYLAAMPWPAAPVPQSLVDLVERCETQEDSRLQPRLDTQVEDLFGVQTLERQLLLRLDGPSGSGRGDGRRSSRQSATGGRNDAVEEV